MRYSKEFKESMIRRMMPPNNESIQHIAQTGGVNEQTLHNWRKAARAEGQVPWGMAISASSEARRTNSSSL